MLIQRSEPRGYLQVLSKHQPGVLLACYWLLTAAVHSFVKSPADTEQCRSCTGVHSGFQAGATLQAHCMDLCLPIIHCRQILVFGAGNSSKGRHACSSYEAAVSGSGVRTCRSLGG